MFLQYPLNGGQFPRCPIGLAAVLGRTTAAVHRHAVTKPLRKGREASILEQLSSRLEIATATNAFQRFSYAVEVDTPGPRVINGIKPPHFWNIQLRIDDGLQPRVIRAGEQRRDPALVGTSFCHDLLPRSDTTTPATLGVQAKSDQACINLARCSNKSVLR